MNVTDSKSNLHVEVRKLFAGNETKAWRHSGEDPGEHVAGGNQEEARR